MSIRITGGFLRGRMIASPRHAKVRPTASQTRQALFNILGQDVSGRMLDLFAGTGVMSVEALSRGMEHCTLVEKNRTQALQIRQNLKTLNLDAQVHVVLADVQNFLQQETQERYDLIYADPPFIKDYPDLRGVLPLRKEQGVAVFEFPTRQQPDWMSEASSIRSYGESSLGLFF